MHLRKATNKNEHLMINVLGLFYLSMPLQLRDYVLFYYVRVYML
jgi:hypothetical protein